MRRFVVSATVLMMVGLGVGVAGQMKITTREEHAKLMKSNAQAFGAANKAIGSGAFADARTQLPTLRQNFMTLQAFWMERKRDDASALVTGALANIDALDKMLSATTVDHMAALATAKQLQGACGACHKLYREGDNQTGFRFRPGVF